MKKSIIIALVICAVQINLSTGDILSVHAQELTQTIKIPTRHNSGPLTPIRLSFDPTDPNKFVVVDVANGSVAVWSINPSFKKELQLNTKAMAVAISPNGEILATSTVSGEIFLWNKTGVNISGPFLGHSGSIQDISFSPDGSTLASGGYDHTVRLWSLTGEQKGHSFIGHTAWVRSVTFSPDGQYLASSSIDGTVIIWNKNGRIHAGPLRGHKKWVESVSFAPTSDLIASAGDDGYVRLWNLDGSLKVPPLTGHRAWVVGFSPCGNLIASTGDDGSVILRDNNGKLVAPPIWAHAGSIQALAFAPNCSFFATGGYYDGTIKFWNMDGTPHKKPLRAYDEWLRVLAITKDGGRVAIANDDGRFKTHLIKEGFQSTEFIGHVGWVEKISFSPNKKYIASASYDGTVKVWTRDATLLQTIKNEGTVASAIDFTLKGDTLLIGYESGSHQIWKINGKNLIDNKIIHNGPIIDIKHLPNRNLVVTMSLDGNIKYWSFSDQLIFEHSAEEKISVGATSKNGEYLATGHESGMIKVWNTKSKALRCNYRSHDSKIRALQFSPDIDMIVSTSDDGSIRFANAQCQNLGKTLTAHNGPATVIIFDHTNQSITTGGYFDSTIKTWSINTLDATRR